MQRIAVYIVVVVQHAKGMRAGIEHVYFVILANRRILRRIDLQRNGIAALRLAVADGQRNGHRSVRVRLRQNAQRARSVAVVCNRHAVRRNQAGVRAARDQNQTRCGRLLIRNGKRNVCGERVLGRCRGVVGKDDGRRVVGTRRNEFAGCRRKIGTVADGIGKARLTVKICYGEIAQRVRIQLNHFAGAGLRQKSAEGERVPFHVRVVGE